MSTLHKTKGIVLKTVRYGETSVIVTIYTELFGIQSYLVNGVRSTSKKGSSKASLFQPAALLDMVVYHNELKQLHRIKEFKWDHIYRQIFSDISANASALFIIELVTRCLKQPEPNSDLFHFIEDILLKLDNGSRKMIANMPLFFAIQLPYHFGFRFIDNHNSRNIYLDLQEGNFVADMPRHPAFLEGEQASIVSDFLKIMQPSELEAVKMNHDTRRQLLYALMNYYAMHIHEFGTMRSLPVLAEVLG